MKRRRPRGPIMPEPTGPRETCSLACGNVNCPANLRRVGKGERFTVARLIGGKQCRGYTSP